VPLSLTVSDELAEALRPYPDRKILMVEATNYAPHATKNVGHKAAGLTAAPLAVPGVLLVKGTMFNHDYDNNNKNYRSVKEQEDDAAGGAIMAGCGCVLIVAAAPVVLIGNETFGAILATEERHDRLCFIYS